jgi:hypothetical protein
MFESARSASNFTWLLSSKISKNTSKASFDRNERNFCMNSEVLTLLGQACSIKHSQHSIREVFWFWLVSWSGQLAVIQIARIVSLACYVQLLDGNTVVLLYKITGWLVPKEFRFAKTGLFCYVWESVSILH